MQDKHPRVCVHGHELNGPLDVYQDGRCKRCGQAAQARWRTKRRAESDLIRALAARGIEVTPDGEMRVTDPAALAKSLTTA